MMRMDIAVLSDLTGLWALVSLRLSLLVPASQSGALAKAYLVFALLQTPQKEIREP
jgi:hypothetical protein